MSPRKGDKGAIGSKNEVEKKMETPQLGIDKRICQTETVKEARRNKTSEQCQGRSRHTRIGTIFAFAAVSRPTNARRRPRRTGAACRRYNRPPPWQGSARRGRENQQT